MMFTIIFNEYHLALQSKGPERDCMHLNNNQQRERGKKQTERLRPVMLLKQNVTDGL